MSFFRYKLIASYGKLSSGVIRLPYNEVMSAISHLERDGSTVIYAKKLGRLHSFLFSLLTARPFKKISRTFQAEFLNNLSIMLRSGMILTTTLEEAKGGSGRPDFEADIDDMIRNIQDGTDFSKAAERYGYIFPKTVLHLIRIGEETGKLDEMLKDASEHLRRVQEIISDTKQALLYPGFVFFAMGAGLLFWFYYVVPKIVNLFKEMDVALPALTVFLLHTSNFIQENILGIVLGTILSGLFFMIGHKKSRQVRKATDMLLLKLPVTKSISSASSMAFISEYFSLLINAGIDIMRSLDILKDAINNEVYREKLEVVKSGLSKGEGIADSLRIAIIFPSFVVRMISVGEQSGTLPDQLAYVSETYRKKLSVLVSTIGKMIEPIVLIVAGGMFAIIIGGLFLPIYDLISAVSSR